ncbi:ER degradation-enhancing alpha-mannosidase-like protein 2 [Parambassis ranga]|uniref:alpha-1,2-Mannosidase n=1 Tax=Parambassis ranga TaxID=210632 RepID=A0A6P7IAD3_9TELE|nr:ER degradation-enhancing alpha-mannosidase-like protein 2 [Parambassis ranga]
MSPSLLFFHLDPGGSATSSLVISGSDPGGSATSSLVVFNPDPGRSATSSLVVFNPDPGGSATLSLVVFNPDPGAPVPVKPNPGFPCIWYQSLNLLVLQHVCHTGQVCMMSSAVTLGLKPGHGSVDGNIAAVGKEQFRSFHAPESYMFPHIDVNASVFETNIRVVGGLLSAHLLAGRAGMQLEPGWPCSGPLLRMAEDAARKLLPAFQTPTGMPHGTVNLLNGVSPTETPVTCTAGVGTFILEFATLSRLTGDPAFENAARQALRALWKTRSDIGLVGNHIDIVSKKWVAQDAGIGAGVDSYFEYLVKGAIMLQDEELLSMFQAYDRAIQNYTRFDDWYLWVQMHKGTVTMPVFQSLEAFWPGLQSLLGNLDSAVRTFQNYYSVWRQFGGLPEFYSIPQGYTVDKREGYPLRPELIESAMYLFRATDDHTYLQLGLDALESIERITKTPCGYASVSPPVCQSVWRPQDSAAVCMWTQQI